MGIEIQLLQSSEPIVYDIAINTYTKGPMFCVLFMLGEKRKIHKYPLCSIFRVIEDYPESKRVVHPGFDHDLVGKDN